jgi:hypothetical protein
VWGGYGGVGRILERLNAERRDGPSSIWQSLQQIKREASASSNGSRDADLSRLPDPDSFVFRRYRHDELLPWDFIDHHIDKWFLLSERKKAHFEHQSPPCDVTRCTVCGAC